MRHFAIFLALAIFLFSGLIARGDSYMALSETLPAATTGTRIASNTIYSLKSGETLTVITGPHRVGTGTGNWYPVLEGRYSEGGIWYKSPDSLMDLNGIIYTVNGPADVRVAFEAQATTVEPETVKVILFKSVKDSAAVTTATNVVIPTDAAGQVEIIIESSADLINWVQALPGAYDASVTNRFFRLRAVVHNED